ncbi:MAG: hypothetical protein HYY48_06460 [Gammaproteobacteria bacterium]|nr:hypothetical protein [Gammaproteobacteria bacterium]
MQAKWLLAIVPAAILAACSDSGTPAPPPAKSESAFKAQTDALEQAKQVEKITLDAAQKQQKAVEEQTD